MARILSSSPRLRRFLAGYAIFCLTGGILLAEVSLRLRRLPLGDTAAIRARLQRQYGATLEDASVTASDGAVLKGWLLRPAAANGESVIILHGLTANRDGSLGFAEMFLKHGYAVLTPDSRAHGQSGGSIVTYGIRERHDTALWVDWLRARIPGCTFLLGESLGAAVGLQTTAATPRLCAVAVESPYTHFRGVTYERMGGGTRWGGLFWRTLGAPLLEVTIAYTRLVYGVYLPDADPEAAVAQSKTPSLLIAGTADHSILMHHAQELQSVCAAHCTLWIVPGAGHGLASSVDHAEFERRILTFFQTHDRVPTQ